MRRSARDRGWALGRLPEATALIERLGYVRKRKRAFDGQTVDMRAIQRQIAAERRRKRDR